VDGEGPVKRIYVSEEAYEALVKYCLTKNKTLRGLAKEASQLLLEIIAQKMRSVEGRETERKETEAVKQGEKVEAREEPRKGESLKPAPSKIRFFE
jgi:hypothetical protein